MGRKPKLDPNEKLPLILARLELGEPLAVICRDDGMPSVVTVWRWEQESEETAKSIARARERGFDMIAADCLEIADDGTNDYIEKRRDDGSTYEAFDAEHVQRSKLRVDTRLKLLAKWDPKRYGDKQSIELDGRLETQGSLADHEAAAKLAAILEAVKKREG